MEHLTSVPDGLKPEYCQCGKPVVFKNKKANQWLYATCVYHNSFEPRKDCQYWKWVMKFRNNTVGFRAHNSTEPDRCDLNYNELTEETERLRKQVSKLQAAANLQGDVTFEPLARKSYSLILKERNELAEQADLLSATVYKRAFENKQASNLEQATKSKKQKLSPQ
jgi:hypothetical protein